MSINWRGKNIVTNGLVNCIDTMNPKSYNGVGINITDLSAHNNTAILASGTYSNINRNILIDGASSNYINLGTGSNNSYNFGAGDFTICIYVNINSSQTGSPTWRGLFSRKGSAATSAGFGIYWNNSLKKFLWSTADGGAASEILSTNIWDTVVENKWAYITMVRQNGATNNGHFYINGVYEPIASSATVLNVNNNSNLQIGNTTDFYSLYWFSGSIGLVQIYNRALTQNEILQNYNSIKNRYGI